MWVGGTWWELKLSDRWNSREGSECLTLTCSSQGALQLSGAVKTAGHILPSELQEQCSGCPPGSVAREVNAGAFHGLHIAFAENGVCWQKFWLAHGNVLVFATYNGTPSAWQAERQAVYSMLASLRPRAAINAAPV
jgi:hypothetical protein